MRLESGRPAPGTGSEQQQVFSSAAAKHGRMIADPPTEPAAPGRLAGALLLVVGGLTVLGGTLAAAGLVDADSEAARLGRGPTGLLLVGCGVVYLVAGWRARRGRDPWRGWLVAAAVAMGVQVVVRLVAFGVVGLGDAVILAIVAGTALRAAAPRSVGPDPTMLHKGTSAGSD